MKPCFIKISSTNRNSILQFYFFIFKKFNFKIGSKILLKNCLNTIKKKKLLTILKSPHVNKKAQEQFEIRTISQQLIIYTIYDIKLIYFLRSLKLKLFSDIRLKIEFTIDKRNSFRIKILDPYNYKLNQQKSTLTQNVVLKIITSEKQEKVSKQLKYNSNVTRNLKKSTAYLNVLGSFGELFLNNSYFR